MEKSPFKLPMSPSHMTPRTRQLYSFGESAVSFVSAVYILLKTLFSHFMLMSQFSYVENLLGFHFADFLVECTDCMTRSRLDFLIPQSVQTELRHLQHVFISVLCSLSGSGRLVTFSLKKLDCF